MNIRCLYFVHGLTLLLDATAFTNNASQNQIETHCFGNQINSTFINCNVANATRLPYLKALAIYNNVKLTCTGHGPPITLSRSIFQANFTSRKYYIVFDACQFVMTPDLFHDVGIATFHTTDFEVALRDPGQPSELKLSFVDAPFNLDLVLAGPRLQLTVIEALSGSKFVTGIKITAETNGTLVVPPLFCNGLPNLSSVNVLFTYRAVLQQSAFYELMELNIIIEHQNNAEISLNGGIIIESKAFFQIDHVHKFGIQKISHISDGAFHSISTIDLFNLNALHDAFAGTLFNNVSFVEQLNLFITPNYTDACPSEHVQCPLSFDIGHTVVQTFKITMLDIVFRLPPKASFVHVSVLVILLPQVKSETDQWVDDIFTDGAGNVKSCRFVFPQQGRVPIFPVNFTSWNVNQVTINHVSAYQNPVCDTSWLTLAAHLLTIENAVSIPLVVRGIATPLRINVTINEYTDCNCSMSWLKQLIDCGHIGVQDDYLAQTCRSNHAVTLWQFLNSTTCCNSSDPPTLNNEPNMPLNCSSFLEMPPELLYFNHSDLPQCRTSGQWRFHPCDVKAFYTAIPSSTTNKLTTTSSMSVSTVSEPDNGTSSPYVTQRSTSETKPDNGTSSPYVTQRSTSETKPDNGTSSPYVTQRSTSETKPDNGTSSPNVTQRSTSKTKTVIYIPAVVCSVVIIVAVGAICAFRRRRNIALNQTTEVNVNVPSDSHTDPSQHSSHGSQLKEHATVDATPWQTTSGPPPIHSRNEQQDILFREMTTLGLDDESDYDRLSYVDESSLSRVSSVGYAPGRDYLVGRPVAIGTDGDESEANSYENDYESDLEREMSQDE